MSLIVSESVAVLADSVMGAHSSSEAHQKELELKNVPATCVICGENENCEEKVDTSVDSMLEFMKSSCGLIAEVTESRPVMCMACHSSIKKMQEAQRAQRALIQRYESRSTNGKNGTKPLLMTNLFKPGTDCNLPEPALDMLSQTDETKGDGIELIITDVKTCPAEECSALPLQKEYNSAIVRSVSTDTRDLIELITLDCDAEDDADCVDSLLGNVQIKQEVTDPELKPPTLPDFPSTSSYDLSRWLPSTSMSEKSFESGFTDSAFSSISKDRLAEPSNGWKCRMCEGAFTSSSELISHTHTAHRHPVMSSEAMACPFCSKQFPTYTQLDDHITQLHGDGSHSCSGCYQVYQRASLLRQHKINCSAYQKQQQRSWKQVMFDKRQQSEDEKKEVGKSSVAGRPMSRLNDKSPGDSDITRCYNCEACGEATPSVLALFKHQDTCSVLLEWVSEEENSLFTAQIRCQGCTGLYADVRLYKSHIEVCSLFQSIPTAGKFTEATGYALIDTGVVKQEVKSESDIPTMDDHSRQRQSSVNLTEEGVMPSEQAQQVAPSTSLQANNICDGEVSAISSGPSQVSTRIDVSVEESSLRKLVETTRCISDNLNTASVFLETSDPSVSNATVNSNHLQSEILSSAKNHTKSSSSLDCSNHQPFICDVCGMDFNFKSLMDFHMVIHTDTDSKPFRCSGCKAGFDAAKHKDCHERLCARTRTTSSVKIEKALAIPQRPISVKQEPMEVEGSHPCTKCHLQFEDVALERTHHASCDGNKCHFCKIMDFATVSELQDHVAKIHHWSSKKATCSLCPAYFINDCFLAYHISTQHGTSSVTGVREFPSKLLCNKCASSFSYFTEMQNHLLNCKARCSTPITESDEMATKHSPDEVASNAESRTLSDSGSGAKSSTSQYSQGVMRKSSHHEYRCSGCDYRCHHWLSAQKHRKRCADFIDKWSKYKPVELHCFMCLIGFANSSNLKIHMQSVHLNESSRLSDEQHICKACNATCSTTTSLKSHVARCITRARKFSSSNPDNTCGVCMAQMHAQSLDRHFKAFHEISLDNMRCGACGDSFNSLHDVAGHMKDCLSIRSLLHNGDKSDDSIVPKQSHSELGLKNRSSNRSDSESISNGSYLGSKRSPCNICGAMSSGKEHMVIHSEEAKQTRTLACSGCDARFVHNRGLASHTSGCLPYKALGMGEHKKNDIAKGANAENDLDLPNDLEIVSSSVVLAPLICLSCGEAFSSTDLYTDHEKSCRTLSMAATESPVHNEPYEDAEKLKDDDGDDQPDEWKCLSCCIRFGDETQFLLHIASHEVTNVSCCFICHAAFRTAADICMHMVKCHKLFLTTGLRQEGDDMMILTDQETTDVADEPSFTVLSKPSPRNTNTQSLRSGNSRSAGSRRSVTPSNSLASPHTTPSAGKCSPSTTSKLSLPKFNHDRITGTVCSVCKRKFASNTILKKHYGIHDGYSRFVCLVCGAGFQKANHCKAHKAKCHKQSSGDFKCPKCDAGFRHKFRRDQHVDLCLCAKYDKVVTCFFCTQTFPTWTQAMGHMPVHLRRCTFCNLKLDTHIAKTKHILVCPNNPLLKPQRFSAARTDNTKTAKWQAAAALDTSSNTTTAATSTPSASKRHSNKPRLKCSECCFETLSRSSLRAHESQHECAEYRCRVCGGKFNSLLAKNRHMLREHGKSAKIIKAAPKEESANTAGSSPDALSPVTPTATFYACEKCDQCFHTKDEKTLHEQTVHNRENSGIKAFNCKLCGKRFPSKFARRRHMQKTHSGPAAQPQSQTLSCHICNKPFPSNFAKLQHLKKAHEISEPAAAVAAATEMGSKKMRPCKICAAVFEHKSELKAHRQEKHADILALRADLIANKDQQFTADGERKRICRICFSTFEHKSDLKNHYKTQHVKPPPLAGLTTESTVELTKNKPTNQEALPERLVSSVQLSASPANKTAESSVPLDQGITGNQTAPTVLAESDSVEAIETVSQEEKNPTEKRKLRVCKECDRLFDTKAELKAHRKSEHKKQVFLIPDSPSSCKKSPGKNRRVVSDVVDLTSDPEDDESSSISPPAKKFKATEPTPPSVSSTVKDDSPMPFRCEHCSKGFKLRISLNKHITKAH